HPMSAPSSPNVHTPLYRAKGFLASYSPLFAAGIGSRWTSESHNVVGALFWSMMEKPHSGSSSEVCGCQWYRIMPPSQGHSRSARSSACSVYRMRSSALTVRQFDGAPCQSAGRLFQPQLLAHS